jgi:hypothetical protein
VALNLPLIVPVTWILLVAAAVVALPCALNMTKALGAFIRLCENIPARCLSIDDVRQLVSRS